MNEKMIKDLQRVMDSVSPIYFEEILLIKRIVSRMPLSEQENMINTLAKNSPWAKDPVYCMLTPLLSASAASGMDSNEVDDCTLKAFTIITNDIHNLSIDENTP
jgi:hypothetical protein